MPLKRHGLPDTIASRRCSAAVLTFGVAETGPPPGKPSHIIAFSKSWAGAGLRES